MKHQIAAALGLCLALSGCATTGAPAKTQLQIREFQTRSFETKDVKMVMKAMINVLQDDGYIIKDANSDLGLLSATKEVDVESKGDAFVATLLLGKNATWAKNSAYEASANVSEFGESCRVRVNFQLKQMDNKGAVTKVAPISDEKHYVDFFDKVNKGIFLAKEGL